MADLEEEIVIHRSKEIVFEIIADPIKATELFVNVSKVELLGETEKQVGSRYREYRQLTNRTVGTEIEILTFEPTKRYQYESFSNGLRVIYEYILREIDNESTNLHFTVTVFPEKLMMKLTKPLIIKMLNKENKDHLKFVKKHLEDTDIK